MRRSAICAGHVRVQRLEWLRAVADETVMHDLIVRAEPLSWTLPGADDLLLRTIRGRS